MNRNLCKKGMVLGIIILFVGAGVVPIISGTSESDIEVTKYVEWDCTPPFKKNVTADIGEYVTFKLYVNNTGDIPFDIYVRDEIPSGLTYVAGSTDITGISIVSEEPELSGNTLYWNFINIPCGTSIVITFKANVNECGEHVNLVNVTGRYDCQGGIYDEDTAIVWVPCPPDDEDLTVEKYVKPDCYGAYQKDISFDISDFSYVTYKIIVQNTGDFTIFNIDVLDCLPTGLAYTINSATVNGVPYEPVISGNDLLWNNINYQFGGYLLPGGTLIIIFRADVFDCGIHINYVDVTGIFCGGEYVYTQDSAIATVYNCYSSVYVDIKPGSCPNPISTKSNGIIPVAICGTEDFDVTTIDPTTIMLEGVSPLRWSYEDVATPFEGELCDCHDLTADGYLDLSLKFNKQEIIAALDEVNDGDVITLALTGNLKEEFGGTPIEGQDCVWIIE